jgi:DGQHR domain-containing protein
MDQSRKMMRWVFEIEDRLSRLQTFYDSDFWEFIAEDWAVGAQQLLEEAEIDQHTFEEKIYNPLYEHLQLAREEIEWKAQARPAFEKIIDDLLYPTAWDLHDKNLFEFTSTYIREIKEYTPIISEEDNKDKNSTGINPDDSTLLVKDFDINKNIKLTLHMISVNPGANVYIGSAKASELHLISKVPSFPNTLGIDDTVARILDINLHRNQWQRPIIQNRIKHINSFLEKPGNFFMNPVILHLNDMSSQVAKIRSNQHNEYSLEIELKQLIEFDPATQNGIINGSNRPLDIIDGQHRVRGAARSGIGHQIEIPFVLAPPGLYSTDHVAKIFTEINTTSKELDKEHQLFLAFRYKLPHYKTDLTMAIFDPVSNNYHDRANRMAYELAAKISQDNMTLKMQIQFLKNNTGNYCLEIVKWQHYVKNWFMPGQPYDSNTTYSFRKIVEEVNNYFSAWKKIVGESWVDGSNIGWNSRTLFQRKTHFRILLTRFVQIHRRVNKQGEIISQEEFESVLKPLTNLRSNDPTFIEKFNKTSEFPWKCLDSWVEDAIDHGISYSFEEIHSESIRGMPGRGVMAGVLEPEFWVVENDERGNWPLQNQTKYIRVHRPKNCYHTLKISVHDGSEILTGISRQKITVNSEDFCRVPIRSTQTNIQSRNEIQIRLVWSNNIDTQEKTIVVRKDQ